MSHTTLSGTVFGAYDDQDRMLSYGSLSYGYTANGSLKFKSENGDTTFYTYDNLGNLISVLLSDGTFIEYMIDGQNRRIGKKVNGEFKKGWIYQNQLTPIAELDSSKNIVSRFVYATQLHIPDYIIKGGITYQIISDHLGSVRMVVNSQTGQVVQYLSYDEFGNIINSNNPNYQMFGFGGGLYDSDTKLIRFGVRDFDPVIGRWLSKDPISFNGGSSNLYTYISNNPVNMVDYWGLYGYEVHYHLTKMWAMRSGFSEQEAEIVASANHGIDDKPTHAAWPWHFKKHFPNRSDVINAINETINCGDLEEFGKLLHSLQDSFSHEGYRWPGHIFEGNVVDQYNPKVGKDIMMENVTKKYMLEYYLKNL